MSQPNSESKHRKQLKRKLKSKKANSVLVAKRNKNELTWNELQKLAYLTFQDIARHHVNLDNMRTEFDSCISQNEELMILCDGLDKSYEDIVLKLIGIVKEHSDIAKVPETFEELLANPDIINNAKYKSGVVKGTSDILNYRSLESDYELINYQLYVVANNVMRDLELRISSEYNKGRPKEEIQKDIEAHTELLKTAKELIDAKKVILETDRELKESDFEKTKTTVGENNA